jgi:hypothetical protein
MISFPPIHFLPRTCPGLIVWSSLMATVGRDLNLLLQTILVCNNQSSKENCCRLEIIYKTMMTVKSIAEYQGFR